MQKKKKKREQTSSIRRTSAVVAFVIILLVGIAIPFFIGTESITPYATQHWDNPHRVCSTEWFNPQREVNNPELMSALDSDELPVIETVTISTYSARNCHDSTGTKHEYLDEVLVRLAIEEELASDSETLGTLIHDVIGAMSSTETAQEWGGLDTLGIAFYVDGSFVLRWYINYQEAFRAYEAGLTGMDMYQIGIIREG